MNSKQNSPAVKKQITPSCSKRVAPVRSSRLLVETLESRIAPAGLSGIVYQDITLGTPQLVTAGHGLKANGQYIMAITSGQALVYTTDINGDNHFDPNDLTGIAAGNGLKMTSFVNINGDIVTNLQGNGTLSNSTGNNPTGHDGLLLLNSKITGITLRSVTAADVTPADLAAAQAQNPSATAASIYTNFMAPSTYSINGNIYAGGGIGDGVVGDGIVIDTAGTTAQVAKYDGLLSNYYQVAGINPTIGAIKTGTAAGGNAFSFGYYTAKQQLPTDPVPGTLQEGGVLKTYTPGSGVTGGDIIGLSVGSGASTDTSFTPSNPVAFTINAIVAGDGGSGAKGGSIYNVTLDGDSGGLRIQAGDGGDGSIGGAGGSILKLSDLGSVEGLVQIKTGSGGEGYTGAGGAAGTLAWGTQFSTNGDMHVDLGNGGNSQGNAGAGSGVTSGTLTPTDTGGIANAVSIITTYRAAGDIGTPKLIDFNGDGFADEVFMTHSPDQIGIAFGTATGYDTSHLLYLAAPGLSSLDTNSPAITVGDFNGDGLPDIAVASSVANSTSGINVFMNPGNDATGSNIWATAALSTTGGNFVDSSMHVTVPNLGPEGYLNSGGAITNLVTGDFNHDGKMDLGYTTQVFAYSGTNTPTLLTAAVVLDGTGDGHFFANFSFNSQTGAASKMPVVFNAEGVNAATLDGQGAFVLKATAAQEGVVGGSTSDVLILSGNAANPYLWLIQQNTNGSMYLNTPPTALRPSFDTAVYVNNAFDHWSSSNATPLDFAVTSGVGNYFDVVVLDQGNNLSLFTGSYNAITGVASMGQTSGVALITQNGLLQNSTASFKGIIAGSFGGADATQFALYTSGAPDAAPTAFYQFDLAPGGQLHGNITYAGDLTRNGTVTAPTVNGAANYDGAIVAFDLFNHDASATANATSFASLVTAGTTFGYMSAMPTSNADGTGTASYTRLIQEAGNYTVNGAVYAPDINQGLNTYAIDIKAGHGGNSDLASGGAGGSIGGGALGTSNVTTTTTVTTTIDATAGTETITTTTTDPLTGLKTTTTTTSTAPTGSTSGTTTTTSSSTTAVTTSALAIFLPQDIADQPSVNLEAGNGGSGLKNGGNGGALSGLNLDYVTGTGILSGNFVLTAGAGGAGFFGQGGNGGNISNFQVKTGSIFTAGNGGSGYQGGNGGSIIGTAGFGGYSTYEDSISIFSGAGGAGMVKGGNGGNISGFTPEFPAFFGGGNGGHLTYLAGSGGNAVAGTGGTGGSILNSSPIVANNRLGGPIQIQAGSGGNGLTGGTGGSASNFSNQSTAGTAVSVVSILAGNGGTGISGNGGAGGSISTIEASGVGLDTHYNDYQYNRIIAGAGGASYGATGGNGGSLNSVNSTASSSSEVLVAGAGGDGLLRGGNGGSVLNSTGDSNVSASSQVLVIAGAGGNAYAALSSASNVGLPGDTNATILALRAFGSANGIGGNGGSISNFTQPKSTLAEVNLIAGNGGSLMNYGSPGDTNKQGVFVSNVGSGGSISNIKLTGSAGSMNSAVAIQTYGGVGTSVQSFVQNILVNDPFFQLTDSGLSGGSVGVIAGVAGSLKASVPAAQGGNLPAGDTMVKTGSVKSLSANGIMSMVAGSVDRIAAINTASGISSINGVYGAYKNTPVAHSSDTADYYYANGDPSSPAPVLGASLMDGAIVIHNNPGGLGGLRVALR